MKMEWWGDGLLAGCLLHGIVSVDGSSAGRFHVFGKVAFAVTFRALGAGCLLQLLL
jgi:hypothetical protein